MLDEWIGLDGLFGGGEGGGNGLTPMHAASQNGHVDVIKLLAQMGGSVHITDKGEAGRQGKGWGGEDMSPLVS